MRVRSILVNNFRCHDSRQIDVENTTTAIIGKNGTGKTSLIEALYIALRGTSFKGSDSDILNRRSSWYRIDILLDDDTKRVVTFDPSRVSGKKQFIVHDKKSYRLSPKDKYPVVLFEPEDLRLIHGSPSRRRQFIDNFISQTNPSYSSIVRKYERALKQRNTLLKNQYAKKEDFFAWDIALSEYGSEIINSRRKAIDTINEKLGDYYRDISNSNDEVLVKYSDTDTVDSQSIMRELEASFGKDRALGHTSTGPHKHDIIFEFNFYPALNAASRGEVRSIVLSLKKIEVDNIKETLNKDPIILLDDVFSELDESRQAKLTEFTKDSQVLITSTSFADNLKDILDVVVVRV